MMVFFCRRRYHGKKNEWKLSLLEVVSDFPSLLYLAIVDFMFFTALCYRERVGIVIM